MNRTSLRVISAVLLSVLSVACNEDLSLERICTVRVVDSGRPGGIGIKAAAPRASLWYHHSNFPLRLTVRFLNGSDFQKTKVMQYAREWSNASATIVDEEGATQQKIRFRFIPYDGSTSGNVTDLRIAFGTGGSSSYVGTDAKSAHPDSATMVFGWVDENSSEREIRQVVLHEFGHAIGLAHEHQSPVAAIPWDKEKVYEYYRLTQNPPWDRMTVDETVFALYAATSTNYTAYDQTSIMHYSIPNSLTIGDFETPWNAILSVTDKEFVKKLYLYRFCLINQTPNCCFDRQGRSIPCI